MKLYTYDPAPNPLRLQLFIQYKGINIDTEQVDLMQGEQFCEDFKKINPLCTVPALLLDDGQLLSETIGICNYLEAMFPEKPLLGSSALEKATILSWDHRLFLEGLLPIAEIFRNGNEHFAKRALPGADSIEQIPQLVARGEHLLQLFWGKMERTLADNNYVAGKQFSIADIDLLAIIGFAGWVQQSVPNECDNINAWHVRAKDILQLEA